MTSHRNEGNYSKSIPLICWFKKKFKKLYIFQKSVYDIQRKSRIFFALNYCIFDLSKEEKCNHKTLMRELSYLAVPLKKKMCPRLEDQKEKQRAMICNIMSLQTLPGLYITSAIILLFWTQCGGSCPGPGSQ